MIMSTLLHCARADEDSEVIEVSVRSGRVYRGILDPQSDRQHLWLRYDGVRASLSHRISWDDVLLAKVAGKEMTKEEVQARLSELARPASDWPWQPPPKEANHSDDLSASGWVADLRMTVELVSRGTNHAPDALSLLLVPILRDYCPTGMSASITIRLDAPVSHEFHAVVHAGGVSWETVSQWNFYVVPQQAENGQYLLELPLDRLRVSRHMLASDYGVLYVRAAISGQRVIERRLDWVPLRRSHPLEHTLPLK
jgi:hypothetical protein